jgi:plastocyanin
LLASAGVDVLASSFAPNPVTIHVGDTVDWIWDVGQNSTTAVKGSAEQWSSGLLGPGTMFSHTFTHVGTFAYYSTSHGSDNGNGTASGMTGTITVVPQSPLMAIVVTPKNFTIAPGASQQYMAMAMYADNTMEDISDEVTWRSSNPSVAMVTGPSNTMQDMGSMPGSAGMPPVMTGMEGMMATVMGMGPGTATITASLGHISGSTQVAVAAPKPAPKPLVTVSGVHVIQNARHMVTAITVDFSGPVNGQQASSLAMYQLTTSGRGAAFSGRRGPAVWLGSASYNAARDEATLTLRRPVSLIKPLQLVIDGQQPGGIQDALGRGIDGAHEGRAGNNATASISRRGVTLSTSAWAIRSALARR